MVDRLVIALGGHALVRPREAGTIPEQRENLRRALGGVVGLILEGHRVAITHGNGPQVGHQLARAEAARGRAYDLPLDVCVAQTQGETGYLLEQALGAELARLGVSRPVVSAVTQVVVDREDPGFRNPTKPVGPVLTPDAERSLRAQGVAVAHDPGRGPRRVVASPRPLRIVEIDAVRMLYEGGAVVIAAGGGGVPVVEREGGRLEGVDAVVDKDLTSAELALALDADGILSLTAVESVKLDYLGRAERSLARITLPEARRYLAEGQFAPGSMGPKIEGAVRFLSRKDGSVVITTPEKLTDALRGRAGTCVVRGPVPDPWAAATALRPDARAREARR